MIRRAKLSERIKDRHRHGASFELTARESDAENRLTSKDEPQRKLDLPVSPLSGGNRARAADPSRRIG